MAKVIDVVLKLKDEMTKPLDAATKHLKAHAKEYTRAGKQIQTAGKKISGVGMTLTKSVTTPLAGVGTAAVKTAADFEQGMADVAAISKSSGKEVDKLSKKAKEMGALGFSAEEVTDAYKYMGMAGWKSGQMIKGVEPIMKLAAATNTELGTTSDIVTDALTAFGAKAKDAGELANILATASTNSNTNVQMLGETFKYVAPVAGAMNFSMAETASIAGLMANAGIKASQAGTAMRSTFSNLAAPTKSAYVELEKLGINYKELAKLPVKQQMDTLRESFEGLSKTEQMAAAKAIAGKNGMSGLLAVVKASKKDYDALTSSIGSDNKALDKMFSKTMDTLKGQIKIGQAELKNLAISFGDILMPKVKQAVSWLQKGVNWFQNLTDAQKKTIVKIAGIAAALGPVLLVFGKVTTKIGGLIKGIGAFGGMLKKFGGIMGLITSPAGVVIGVLAAIAAAVAFVAHNWDKLKEPVLKCWDAIKPVINTIQEAVSSLFTSTKDKASNLNDALVSGFKSAFEMIADLLKSIAPMVADIIKTISGAIKSLMPVIKSIIKVVKDVLPPIMAVASKIIKTIGRIIKALTPIVTKVVNVVGKILSVVSDVIGKIVSSIADFIEDNKETIDGIVSFISDAIDLIAGIIGGLIDYLKPIVDNAVEVIGGITDFLSGIFSGNWDKAWEGLKNTALGVVGAIDSALGGLFSKHASNLLDFFGIGISEESMQKNQRIRGYFYDKGLLNRGYNLKSDDQGKISIVDKNGNDVTSVFKIDGLASGTSNWRGGTVQVNEKGGEIIDLPAGSRVYPHDKSVEKAYRDGRLSTANNNISLTIPKLADSIIIREDADIDKIVTKMTDKLEKVALNLGSSELGYAYQS